MLVFVIFIFLNGVMEGGGGLNSTQLNGATTATATTITVDDTTGFLTADLLVIGDEEITYTGVTAVAFTGCTRGFNRTTAETHADNTQVYSPDAGVLNRTLNFNIATTGSTAGSFAVITMTLNFMLKALPNLIMWDFAFLQGQLIFIRIMLMAIGTGLVVMLGIQFLTAARGILLR